MAITTKTQSALVQGQVTAMQASSAALLDFSDGSVLLALVQANGGLALWLQAVAIQLAITTRASTSQGGDLDSWVGDFDVTRLNANYSSGSVTFSRFSTGTTVIVQVGDTVETLDGTQQFVVTADPTNPFYRSVPAGYAINTGVSSITVPVTAVVAGSGANVAVGTVTTITGAISGVDTVTNPAAFANGSDAESDTALRVRFKNYINSRSQSTPIAIEYAIQSVQQNIRYKLIENYNVSGAYQPGYFTVVIDDGTGTPPASLIAAVTLAVDAGRPIGSQFDVFAPQLISVAVVMTIVGGSATAVQSAISAYISSAGLGGSIIYTKLSQVAYNADPAVTDVTGVTLNGGTSDLITLKPQRPMPGTITVNE